MAAVALLVAAGYYLGVRAGLVLRLPPATPSILWPPNAFLAAVLLLSPPRRWAIYLLAALPVHLIAELAAGWPAPMVVLLFVTNCSEALLAAVLIRAFSDVPTGFDTVRRVSVFLAAAVVAPFLTSFPDAAVVSWLGGEPAREVWRARFPSNVLAALLLIPALVTLVTGLRDGWRRLRAGSPRPGARPLAETVLVVLALTALGLWILAAPAGMLTRTGSARVTLILPVLLLATTRFGPAGASLSLFGTGVISLWTGIQGRGPFSAMPPDDGVVALQIVLIALGMPLLLLGGALGERTAARRLLEERLVFEGMLSQLAGAFVHLPGHAVGASVEEWLKRFGEWLGVDQVSVLLLSDSGSELRTAFSWARTVEPVPAVVSELDLPTFFGQLRREEAIRLPPREATGEIDPAAGEWLRRHRGRSVLALPMVAGGRVLGAVCFAGTSGGRRWPVEVEHRLELMATVLGSALARQEAEGALRESEAMTTAILASLPSRVTVLDRDGRVHAVYESWSEGGQEDHGPPTLTAAAGDDYLELCRRVPIQEPAALAAGVAAVLAGERTALAIEYPLPGSDEERWLGLTVTPLRRAEGGAVVAHTDITERKRAEVEARRSREEMAHFSRVSTLGVLSGSLAHEINQPLTGIMSNAQAAQRLLAAEPADRAELDQILQQIVGDVKRASGIIRQLREMMKKGGSEHALLDLNQVVDDVVALLHSDAVIRGVSLIAELAPSPLEVVGDRVQLQQVVLNLATNAIEALPPEGGGERSVWVRTAAAGATARVSIEDTGPGVSAEVADQVFEPFFTTKRLGMGLGLTIARSIVASHRGTIEVRGPSAGGASFRFTLPLAAGRPS